MLGKPLLGVACLVLLVQPASAHHPTAVSGSGGAGPINTIAASTLDQGQSALLLTNEFIRFNQLSDAELINGAALSGSHVHSLKSIESVAVTYAYGITKDLTVSARLPWIKRSDIREVEDPGDPPEFLGNSSGIGDLTLMSQYRFYNNQATQTEAALLLGVKAPTGATHRLTDTGEQFDAEFQPGSGSWDGLFGLAFTKRVGPWSFDTSVLYVQVNKGVQDTDLGDRVLYNAAVSYRLTGPRGASSRMKLGALPEPMYHGGPGHGHSHQEVPAGPTLDLILELNGEWHAHEIDAGVKDPNSGGNTVYLSPGLRLSMDKWSGFVSVGIPIVNHSNGFQSEADVRVFSGIAVTF